MVKFNKDANNNESFTITCKGSKNDYLETIKSLLAMIRYSQEDVLLKDEMYFVTELIESILPDAGQIVSPEEAEYLEAVKKQNNATASVIIGQSKI